VTDDYIQSAVNAASAEQSTTEKRSGDRKNKNGQRMERWQNRQNWKTYHGRRHEERPRSNNRLIINRCPGLPLLGTPRVQNIHHGGREKRSGDRAWSGDRKNKNGQRMERWQNRQNWKTYHGRRHGGQPRSNNRL